MLRKPGALTDGLVEGDSLAHSAGPALAPPFCAASGHDDVHTVPRQALSPWSQLATDRNRETKQACPPLRRGCWEFCPSDKKVTKTVSLQNSGVSSTLIRTLMAKKKIFCVLDLCVLRNIWQCLALVHGRHSKPFEILSFFKNPYLSVIVLSSFTQIVYLLKSHVGTNMK